MVDKGRARPYSDPEGHAVPLDGLWASILLACLLSHLLAHLLSHLQRSTNKNLPLTTIKHAGPKTSNCQQDMAWGKGRECNTIAQTQLKGHPRSRSKQDVKITRCLM